MDGQSATLRQVRVVYDGLHLIIHDREDGRELSRWTLAEVRADAIQERDVVQLETSAFPDALLTLRGVEVIASLAGMGVRVQGLPRDAGRRLTLAVGCVAGIGILAGLIWSFITPVSKAVARRIPLEVERSISGSLERQLADAYCETNEARAELDQLAMRLLDDPTGHTPIHVLNLSLANAFALPGGTVVLTRGLIEQAAGPDEIAGILAHELEHVRQRHVMAGMVRGAFLSTLWAVSVGDFTGLMILDPSTAFKIATLEFSREDEAEADRGALAMLARAKINANGLAEMFTRLEEEAGDVPEWLSSHPASGLRSKAAARASLSDSGLLPALSDESWRTLVEACDDAEAPESELRELFF